MINTKYDSPVNIGTFLFIILNISSFQVFSTETIGSTIDCSTVKIDYNNNPEWSRNERLDAMNKAFFDSVNRFELCHLANQSNSQAASGNGSAQSSNSGDGDGENGNGQEQSSTKSATMSGTETKTDDGSSPSKQFENAKNKPSSSHKTGNSQTQNGAKPKDIPNANNDDVIASQIRLAAEIEQDSIKKAKLWNEYRKYKGLPTK